MCAAREGHFFSLTELIDSGSSVDHASKDSLTALHWAAHAGYVLCLKKLLDAKINKEAQTIKGKFTALHGAAAAGKVECVIALIEAGASTEAKSKNGQTPFHLAAQNGHTDCVKLLHKCGADVNKTCEKGFTPLHIAAMSDHIETMECLIYLGAVLDSYDEQGATPFHLAATNDSWADCLRLMKKYRISLDIKDKKGLSLLHWAAMKGKKECVMYLMGKPALKASEGLNRESPLHLAILNGQDECAEVLAQDESLLNKQDANGNTALHVAATKGLLECLKILIRARALRSIQNKEGRTPLHLAVLYNQVSCVKVLLMAGVEKEKRDEEGRTPFHIAYVHGHHDCMKELEKWKVNTNVHGLNKPSHDALTGTSASTSHDVDASQSGEIKDIHQAAVLGDQSALINFLEKGVYINLRDEQGQSPFVLSIMNNRLASAKLLIERGASVNARADGGFTPLHFAAFLGQVDLLSLLKEKHAVLEALDDNGLTPLHIAVIRGQIDSVRALLSYGAKDSLKTPCGRTPLYLATETDQIECLHLLLTNNSVTVNAQAHNGWSPLHVACRKGNLPIVDLLCNNGALVNCDTYETSPLHCAVESGNNEVVKYLVMKGANIEGGVNPSYTPFIMAVERNNFEGAHFLKAQGAETQKYSKRLGELLIQDFYKGQFANSAMYFSLGADLTIGRLLMTIAIDANEGEVIEKLIESGVSVDQKSSREESSLTGLQEAAAKGSEKPLEIFLKHGADINVLLEGCGDTLLHEAAGSGSTACLILLLSKGLPKDGKNKEGQTPLHMAARLGKSECVRVLLQAGVDKAIQDNRGKTAAQLASEKKHTACSILLDPSYKNSDTINKLEKKKVLISDIVESDRIIKRRRASSE